ncbi:MAG TPA: DUF3048 domain-containing protein, partial [Acidimicrobiales bacterium]|nr:DUF3048 domain-containing protein [Acidimicrobiales bacterium]
MQQPTPFTRRAFVAGLLATPVLAACGGGGDDDEGGADTTAGEDSSTTDTTLATTTTAPPLVAPLTGLPYAGDPAVLQRQALIVKIDNADNGANTARPQAGFNQADIVIEELVEGGVTRLAAVFHSADSDPVGPIRSARITDLEYVSFFGQPLFAWSGGNLEVAGAIRGSTALQDVGYDVLGGDAYYRASDRRSPHNLMSSTPALYAAAAGGAPPPPVLTYG